MSVLALTIKNIKGNPLRSLVVFLCVFGIASFFSATTLIVRGAENSLQKGLERLGADLLVVPEGAEQKVETALLMGKPTTVWMPAELTQRIRAVPGVAAVSPQVYLQSLYGASCCAVNEMFLVVYDPDTDFVVTPWINRNLGRRLARGEVIGGHYIFVPPGEKHIRLYGYSLTLRGNLEATGTGLDQTIFLTMETALDMARSSLTTAEQPLDIPPGKISSVMVRVTQGADAHKIALQMLLDVIGVVPIESPNLFGAFRQQMLGLLWGFIALTSLSWVLSAVLLALVFSMAANERHREMAVLRALGATRLYVFWSLQAEAVVLALGAGAFGFVLGSFVVYLFRDYLAGSLRMPFLFPPVQSLAALFGVGIALSLLTAAIAALIPALRISRREPALAMRE